MFACSPIDDILAGEEFTLQDLLREDDLLQEVASGHNLELVRFLSQNESMKEMISYITEPVENEEEDELIVHK